MQGIHYLSLPRVLLHLIKLKFHMNFFQIGDLALFGLEHSELFSGGVDTILWMAPELLNRNSKNNLVTEKVEDGQS